MLEYHIESEVCKRRAELRHSGLQVRLNGFAVSIALDNIPYNIP